MHARDVICCLVCLGAVVAVLIAGMYGRSRLDDSSSTSSAGSSGSGGASYNPMPAKQVCSCGSGKVSCSCGNGYVYDHNNQPQRHHLCGGSGEVTCPMCHGTRLR